MSDLQWCAVNLALNNNDEDFVVYLFEKSGKLSSDDWGHF